MRAGQRFRFHGELYRFNHWEADGSANALHVNSGHGVWLSGVASDPKIRRSNERNSRTNQRELKAAADAAEDDRIRSESYELIHNTPALRRLLEDAVSGRLDFPISSAARTEE